MDQLKDEGRGVVHLDGLRAQRRRLPTVFRIITVLPGLTAIMVGIILWHLA